MLSAPVATPVLVLLSASVDRFGVSRMRDFYDQAVEIRHSANSSWILLTRLIPCKGLDEQKYTILNEDDICLLQQQYLPAFSQTL